MTQDGFELIGDCTLGFGQEWRLVEGCFFFSIFIFEAGFSHAAVYRDFKSSSVFEDGDFVRSVVDDLKRANSF